MPPVDFTGGSCAGSPKSSSVGKYLLQIRELLGVEHARLVDEADIERLLAALPAGDEIRAPQPRGGQRAGDGAVAAVEGQRAVERLLGQPLDRRLLALPRQPLGDLLVLRVIDGGVEDAVDGGGGHAAHPQHARRLVGGCQHRERAPVAAAPPLPVGRDHLDARRLQPAAECGQQQRLARAGLAHHGEHALRPLARGGEHAGVEIDPHAAQRVGDAVMGLGLIGGIGQRGLGHGPSLAPRPTGRQSACAPGARSALSSGEAAG